MDDSIVAKLFIIKTLEVFNQYDPKNSKIIETERSGGGYSNDGCIYGYKVTLENGIAYSIILDEKYYAESMITDHPLRFAQSNDEEQDQRELDMLNQFCHFSNAYTISSTIRKYPKRDSTNTKGMKF